VINSKVELSNYIINLNTREIIANQNKLKLTEREKDFLLFLNNSKKPQTIRNILEAVWGYSKDIETHTVETHVHRLRKKFFSTFNDSNFIKNNKKGYYI
jgi:DNA-binding response OmpR family regulator